MRDVAGVTRRRTLEDAMKYLNDHKNELFAGKKITYRGKVYWANLMTNEIYALSDVAYKNGVINGYRVGVITEDGDIVKA